ncbi:MAG: hypothetical protein ABR549_15975, partial [Mycobacteriales bacterium]
MDFSTRLARAAAAMTWLCLVVATVAVAVMAHVAAPDGFVIHEYAYYSWQTFGVVVTGFLTVMPTLAMRSHFVLKNIGVIRVLLLVSDTVWCAGSTSVVGGIAGPFWFCFIGVVLFAAVSLKGWQAGLFGCAATAGVVLSSAIAHTMDRSHLGELILVGAIFPIVAWFNSSLAGAVWSLRTQASNDRKALEARVTELSAVLQQAAAGDLAVSADVPETGGQLAKLSAAFNDTLGNLRGLVDSIRGGGEQIAASAGELLASAEEHAASATQQSSAVSETTSTIEELAATAAQIAETSEAVARY